MWMASIGRVFRGGFLALLTVALAPAAADAQGSGPGGRPKPSAAASALVQIIGIENLLDEPSQQVVARIAFPIFMQNPDRQRDIVSVLDETTLKIIRGFYGAVSDDVALLYDEAFTPEEIAELTRFYQSPLGGKVARNITPIAVHLNHLADMMFATREGHVAFAAGANALQEQGIKMPAGFK
jgi:hypothetical protein